MIGAADDSGQVGGVEGVIFGVLVFVIGTLVIANAWAVIDAKLAVAAAAREATRTFVEFDAADVGAALADADAAGRRALAGHGRDPARLQLALVEGELARCARVEFEASYQVPAITLPIIGGRGVGFTAASRHVEVVDPYRSGLTRSSRCPAGFP